MLDYVASVTYIRRIRETDPALKLNVSTPEIPSPPEVQKGFGVQVSEKGFINT